MIHFSELILSNNTCWMKCQEVKIDSNHTMCADNFGVILFRISINYIDTNILIPLLMIMSCHRSVWDHSTCVVHVAK